ncbi:glycosyltransferase family 2 protein [Streptomyces sp. NPDC008079]|uniref:glycosyltransferase family 2 protein n=1 Tax=Streptomyces sp. NPDC008079 TaxID=3364806 RepID=UPI0036E7CCE2
MPCLDEAAALPWVLDRVPPGWRAIVVDNGSTDGSARIAAEHGAYVVHAPVRGFGAACHAGLLAATADVVCFCDCDGSLDPALLPTVAGPVLDGAADLVLGRRRPTTFRAWPPHARLANLQLARLLRRRTGLRLHDLGPMRAARREDLLALALTDRRSGYPLQMVVRAADADWRIRETPVPYAPRTGRSKVTGTWRGTWHAVRDMTAVLNERAGDGRAGTEKAGDGRAGGGRAATEKAGNATAGSESAGHATASNDSTVTAGAR